MTNLVIKDLEQNLELDREAMNAIRGAWSLGGAYKWVKKRVDRVTTRATRVALGAHGAALGGALGFGYGFLRSGVPGGVRKARDWGRIGWGRTY